ncbi:hypothetical protein T01_589 [Trichinella spiralis]|uniref:Uncharacterized protein n=1 Tax=Trichinella spiralis TaxID=6334 RepID=A0A0V1B2K4_TRISP|nr:hypothetical protein T01_13305 [Trichinella spiralis]KRY31230.1 hypothetical protein T01_589 [Trichinella spiralis]
MTKNNAICMHALLASAEQQRMYGHHCFLHRVRVLFLPLEILPNPSVGEHLAHLFVCLKEKTEIKKRWSSIRAVACQASTDDCSKLGHACVHQQQQAGRSLGYCFFGKLGFFLLFPLDDPCCVVCRSLAVKNSSAIKCPKIHLTPPDVHTQTAVLGILLLSNCAMPVLFLYLDAGFRRSQTKSVRTASVLKMLIKKGKPLL